MKAFLLFLSLLFFSNILYTQIPSWEENNPFFEVNKIELSHKKSFKHKTILGAYKREGILVECENQFGTSRQLIWVDNEGRQIDHLDYNQKRIKKIIGIQEIASFSDKFMFLSIEKQGNLQYYLSNFKNNKLQTPTPFQTTWNYEILNPCLFQLPTSNYPALIFASRTNKNDHYDLFVSEQIGTSWTYPERIKNQDINSPFDETHPSVSGDGMLFFSSNRPQAKEQSEKKASPVDLWFARPDYRKYWLDTPVNPFPAPLCSSVNDQNIVAIKNNFKAGFFVSDRADGIRELYSYKFTLTDEDSAQPIFYHALLIGVNDYEYLKKLESPLVDIPDFAEILRKHYGFQVSVLPDPTTDEILKKLADYQNLQENEYLLISFFGHGIKLEKRDGSPYCVLAGRDGKMNGDHCITPTVFQRALNSIDLPKHILVVLDACYSGLFFPPAIRGEFDNASRKMMTSTKSDVVFDASPFYNFLSEKLVEGKENMNVLMLGKEVYDYIFKKMSALSNKINMPDYDDLPNSGGGEFPFPDFVK